MQSLEPDTQKVGSDRMRGRYQPVSGPDSVSVSVSVTDAVPATDKARR